jgi:hypothetical protein
MASAIRCSCNKNPGWQPIEAFVIQGINAFKEHMPRSSAEKRRQFWLKPKELAVSDGAGVEKALHKFLVARAKQELLSRGRL